MSIDRHFISEIDKQLADFDQQHPLGDTQTAEVNKYQRIYELRDNKDVATQSTDDDLWD